MPELARRSPGLDRDSGRSLAASVTIIVCLEVLYATTTRLVLPSFLAGNMLEMAISVERLLAAGIAWLLFKGVIRTRRSTMRRSSWPVSVAALIHLLATPVLI